MAEKFSKGVRRVTTTAIEMRKAIIEIAGPRKLFDSRELWLDRAARAAGISKRTAKAIFYCECADPRASVVEKIREAQKRRARDDAEAIAAGKREYTELLDRIARLEAALAIHDPDFHEHSIDALRGMARAEDQPLD